jgi:hypothetical protein
MKTQGQKLIAALKRRSMTNLELLMLGVSTCPWKRIRESMPEGWRLDITKNPRGLNVYRVVRSK